MRISRKLVFSLVAMQVLITLVGAVGLNRFDRLEQSLAEISDVWQPSIRAASGINAESLDFRNRETQLLIARNSAEIDDAVKRGNQNLEALRKFDQAFQSLIHGDEEKALYAAYREKLEAYLATHERMVALAREGRRDESIAYFEGDSRKAIRALRPTIDAIVDYTVKGAEQAQQEARTISRVGQFWIVGINLVALAIGAVLAFWLYGSIVRPLQKIRQEVLGIEQSSDFTRQLDAHGHDEIGETAQSVNHLTASVRAALQSMLAGIAQVASAADSLAEASRQVSAGSGAQSEAASSMAATVEQLTVSINQVADNASRAFELAQTSGQVSREGGGVIANAVDSMGGIARRIEETAAAIRELGVASQEISGIVQVIKEVADQTNLLALNAAIEAARAGEQGRGFAVVADEVRKLAERTALATQDIAAKIAAIQSGVDHASSGMEQAVGLVEQGVTLADTAGGAVTRITAGAAEVEAEVNTISGALREQGEASNQIAGHVEQIAQMSEENNRGAENTAQLSGNLAALAQEMRQTAERFKV